MHDKAAKDIHVETELAHPMAAPAEEPSHEKFVGGAAPPVHDGKPQQGEHHTASQVAFAEDDHTRELKSKVGALVANKFGGDYKAAFDHYDADKDGAVSKDELIQLLSDAGVGNGLTRGKWASGIIEKLDSNGDGAISWSEFESVFKASV